MTRFKSISIILIISTIITLINNIEIQATSNVDIFNKIISLTNSNIEKVCVETIYSLEEEFDNYYEKINCQLNFNSNNMSNYIDYKNNYIEFKIDNIKGILENIDYNKRLIKLTLIEDSKENTINNLKKLTENILGKNYINQYSYIKTKLLDKNIKNLNNEIKKYLKDYKAENFNTIKLDNGYSTVCNTKLYKSKTIGDTCYDFQFAVMKYNSGNYLIMGTPEITLAF